MEAQQIINYIATSEKKTPCKIYLNVTENFELKNAKVFGNEKSKIVFANWDDVKDDIEKNKDKIKDIEIECDRRNSGVPMLDIKNIKARIEPGAIIREKVEIGDNAVIMMGAVINIGAVVGQGTMIDMGAVLGGRAIVGNNCHIGAGAVLAGVVEPASATPVIVEDGVLVGANAVIVEGVHVGKNAVVAAGAVCLSDVPDNAVVAGCPAKVIKTKDEKTESKTALLDALRTL